jgi:hypothetical protein
MASLTIIGYLTPYTGPNLLDGTSTSDADALPFVVAARKASIGGLSSMNVVIMIMVRIVGNSLIHSLSRTLAALADRGQAPKTLGYVDRYRRRAGHHSTEVAFICNRRQYPRSSLCLDGSDFRFYCHLYLSFDVHTSYSLPLRRRNCKAILG